MNQVRDSAYHINNNNWYVLTNITDHPWLWTKDDQHIFRLFYKEVCHQLSLQLVTYFELLQYTETYGMKIQCYQLLLISLLILGLIITIV